MQSLENITVRSCDAKICLTYIARKLGMWFACITLGRRKEGMYRMIATLQTNIRGERESVSCRTEVIYKYRIILLLCGRHWSLVTPRDNPSHQSTRYTHTPTYVHTYIHTITICKISTQCTIIYTACMSYNYNIVSFFFPLI